MPRNIPSVMKHNFSLSPQADIQRSQFNRSHGYKTTFDAGYLIPVFVDEALPGDTFNLKMQALARLATPEFPIMDNMVLDSHFFAVPNRLLWTNWEKFNGAQDDPADSTSYTIPQMTAPATVGHAVGSLSDYMGLPTGVADYTHSALWHRAYNLIYNEWFRDENLQDSVVVDTGDAASSSTDYSLLRRGKRYDYFTSCLPWTQKVNDGTTVTLPLGTSAPVISDGLVPRWLGNASGAVLSSQIDTTPTPDTFQFLTVSGTPTDGEDILLGQADGTYTGLKADLSTATAATINQLREAFQLQKLFERDARGGTRYIEIIKSHFGVTSPDARLQRPEYLGGGTSDVVIYPVAQTSESGTTDQGNLAGFGVSAISGHGFTKSFTEHCTLIGLVSVRADLNYQQGLNRMFSRSTRYDFYWPALSHIGEQSVLNKEIYMNNDANDDLVFGYQERYAEYRYKPSQITGQFRSTFASSLDAWHLAQEFSTLPTLGDTFIQENPPVDRITATADDAYPHFLLDAYFNLKCARPMPVYSVPGLIDHF